MKVLRDILYKCRVTNATGAMNVAIEHLASDSRLVKPFSLFVALRGTQTDGHDYIEQAIQRGAIAVVCEEIPAVQAEKVTYVSVENAAEALGYIAANFYDNPSNDVKVIAVTGTNGKTTTVTLLYQLFRLLNKPSGLLSTVVNRINDRKIQATHTTPDAIQLNKLLREMADSRIEYCFMEASSHAIDQHRITGVKFAAAVFTNITHDHLDYHGSFNNYIKAKKGLFDRMSSGSIAVINNDDNHGEIMVQNCKSRVVTFGMKTMCEYRAKLLEHQFTGMQLLLDSKELFTKLIGSFNAMNLLAVYAVAREMGMDQLDVLTNMSMLGSVEGRFQYLRSKAGITGIVDYAHTPDALSNVLETISEIRTRNEQVITVVGCGGDRDRHKRPIMARIAAELSDRVILTSDNPRSEDPGAILAEMRGGLDPVEASKTFSITDRREAIRMAVSVAQPGDIILVAGKGHEKYQEINGERLPFDDLEVISETFNTL